MKRLLRASNLIDLLWWFLLGASLALLALACSSCHHPTKAAVLPPADAIPDLQAALQRASAVSVYVECDFPKLTVLQTAQKALYGFSLTNALGSGFALSTRHVGTALHVVDCDEYEPFVGKVVDGKPRKVTVKYLGEWREFRVVSEGFTDRGGRYVDAAMLEAVLPGDVFRVHATEIGPPPKLGDEVCVVASVPFASRSCGPVVEYRDGRRWMGLGYAVYKLANIPGNSGSGVYDSAGRLVAVHVASVGDDKGGGLVLGAFVK